MHFNEVLLIPGCGHFGDESPYDSGHCHLNLHEIDVVREMARALDEALTHVKIRTRILPTLKKPGLTCLERFDFIQHHDFVIHLKAGFKKPHPTRNDTILFHGKDLDPFILKGLEENCREYGKLASFYHKQQRSMLDTSDKYLTKSLCKGIRLEVFYLNGPDIDHYYALIPHLAKSFALTLEEARRLHKSDAQKAR